MKKRPSDTRSRMDYLAAFGFALDEFRKAHVVPKWFFEKAVSSWFHDKRNDRYLVCLSLTWKGPGQRTLRFFEAYVDDHWGTVTVTTDVGFENVREEDFMGDEDVQAGEGYLKPLPTKPVQADDTLS